MNFPSQGNVFLFFHPGFSIKTTTERKAAIVKEGGLPSFKNYSLGYAKAFS